MFFAEQGDLLLFSGENRKALVLSKDFFNRSGLSVVCPVVSQAAEDALHIPISTEKDCGIALCEHLKTADLKNRRYKKIGTIPYSQIQEVTDAVQAIFDYYPYG